MSDDARRVAWVRWRDAAHSIHETPISDIGLIELEEVGWLIKEDIDGVGLAVELPTGDPPSTRNYLFIPRDRIVEMRVAPWSVVFGRRGTYRSHCTLALPE